jgi:hypothetical protein
MKIKSRSAWITKNPQLKSGELSLLCRGRRGPMPPRPCPPGSSRRGISMYKGDFLGYISFGLHGHIDAGRDRRMIGNREAGISYNCQR